MNFKNMTQLITGLFLYALGLVLTVNANLGVTPWNTFHMGLSKQTGLSLGNAIIITGLVIIVINILAKQSVGIGTILNMWLIGSFVDIQMSSGLVPQAQSFLGGLVLIFMGMFAIAIASWLYIGAGLGAGPRDGFMVAVMKWTGKPVGIVRASIEISVLIVGILLGGKLGIGTPIIALLLGPICQWVFGLLKFDVKNIDHQYLSLKKSV
ncbi:YczE/YyaS/YitT family protein [Fusibacter sp. JL216-2]|uniref:YczE/YyaS/YitT family protein n=1 Tax=Fusibacter sp. JL216-2 TaxID=3071453 RepID=UPI003D33CE70